MSLEPIYKGQPIPFTIEQFEDEAETIPVNWTAYDDVICYVYTERMDIKKFALVKSGYLPFESSSTNFALNGIVPGALTKLMHKGQVTLEIWTASGGVEQQISVSTIYDLVDSKIKAES